MSEEPGDIVQHLLERFVRELSIYHSLSQV